MKRKEITIFKSDFLSIFIVIEDKVMWKNISLIFRVAKLKRLKAFRNWKKKLSKEKEFQ